MDESSAKVEAYEIRVRGELSDQLVEALGGSRPVNATTTILIIVEDRAALHSAIRRVEDFALELVSVTPVSPEARP